MLKDYTMYSSNHLNYICYKKKIQISWKSMEIFMFGLKIHVADLTFHRRGQEHIIKKKRGKPTKTNIKNNIEY